MAYFKREPKNKKDFRGLAKVNPACCGMTCCGLHGKSARQIIRQARRATKKNEIQAGLKDYDEVFRFQNEEIF